MEGARKMLNSFEGQLFNDLFKKEVTDSVLAQKAWVKLEQETDVKVYQMKEREGVNIDFETLEILALEVSDSEKFEKLLSKFISN